MPRAENPAGPSAKQSRPRRRPGPLPFVPPSLDLEDVLRAVVASAAELSGATVVTIWTANEDARILERQAVSDDRLARDYPFRTQAYGTGGVGWVALHRRPLNVRRIADDVRLVARDWCQARGLTSYLGLPIAFEGVLLGVLSLLGRAPFKLGVGERRRLEAFVVQAAAAIRNAHHFAASEARRRSAEALAEVGRVITQGLDPDLVAASIADSVQTLLAAPTAAMYRCDPEAGGLALLAQSRLSDPAFQWTSHFAQVEAVVGLAIRARATVTTADLALDPRIVYPADLRARLAQWPYRSVLAVPLLAPDGVLGVLAVADFVGRAFTREATQMAEAFADQAVIALDNARLYDEARRRQHEAETLARLAQTLTESLDVGDVGRRIVESVLPVFGVRSAGLRLIQPDGSLVTVARSAAAGMHSVPGNVVPPGTGISGRAIADGRAVRTSNLLDDPGIVVTPHMRAQALASGERAMLAVPLRVKGRIIGSLSVADREGRTFLHADATLLQGFADQAALALENARLYGEAERRRRAISSQTV